MTSRPLRAARCCVLIYLTTVSAPALAETAEKKLPPVVVSAHAFETPAEEVGSAVTVITEEEIERSGKTQVLEVLEQVPYVDVIRSGGPGGNTSVFIRGANSEHTLVLLDGIELNDPSTTSRSFNFAHLSLTNIERIEVLRGPQSLMYGSDAIGGVIAIYTKKGTDAPSASGSFEAGSYSTFNESVAVRGSEGRTNYSLALSRQDTENISAAEEDDGNSERDAYANTTFAARAGFEATEDLHFALSGRYQRGDAELDNTGGVGGDDRNRELTNELVAVRAQAEVSPFGGISDHTIGVAYTDHATEDDNDPDPAHPGEILRSDFDGTLLKFDLFNRFYATEKVTILAGASTEKEKASSYVFSDGPFGPFENIFTEQEMRTTGVFTEMLLDATEWFNISSGVRWDDNSEAGSEVTYRISPVATVSSTGTRILGRVGTGFKAPSLFQLFSSFGNQGLDTEKSSGWEVGAEQPFYGERIVVGATWFRNTIDNLITFDNQTFLFENINEARLQGLEVFARAQLSETVGVRFDYTYTDTKNLETAQSLLRRARNKFAAEIFSNFADTKGRVSLRTTAFSSRYDNDFSEFPPARTEIAGYMLVDIAASYQLTPRLALTARADNIFDTDYQEVLGFGTRGAALYGGIKVTL